MRCARSCSITLLILFLFTGGTGWTASKDGPVAEIILDCSLAMKGAGPEHSSRIGMAWIALARLYQRLALEPPGSVRMPALRLAGGAGHPSNPWRPGELVCDGGLTAPPFLPGRPMPPEPLADGLLPLSSALTDAAAHLPRRGNVSQGFLLLIAAGWEGGTANPHDLGNGSDEPDTAPVIHVIGLAPSPAESRQLRQLAARSGGIYREVGGLLGLEQALYILAGSGGIYFSAASANGDPPPDGSRLRITDRRGWYRRNFDFQNWRNRGGQIWIPAGPYDLELFCSGRAEPFPVPPLSVERGKISRRRLTLPEQGLLRIRIFAPEGSTRDTGASISIFDERENPVYRVHDQDQCAIPLFPGEFRARVRPFRSTAAFGESNHQVRIQPRIEETLEIPLPPEGRLVIDDPGDSPHRIRIENRGGTEVWSGRLEGPLSLPEGRYRIRVFGDDGKRIASKRFRIKGGETRRLGPFSP